MSVPEALDAGIVQVLYGSPGGLTASGDQVWHQDSPGIADNPETSDNFGAALATGDFNGDGFDDLVVGVPEEDIGAIEDAISDQLPGGRRLFIDTFRLTRGTMSEEAQAYQLFTANKAVMTPDEVRERMGLPPVENPEDLNPTPPAPVIAAPGDTQKMPMTAGGKQNG